METFLSNLLIVEDNSFIRNNIFNAVKDIKNIENILQTEFLHEAISYLNETDFELIILDLKLPDGNGLNLLKMLKEKKSKVSVFVFSVSVELKKTCLKYGACTFYDTSQDFDKMIAAINKVYKNESLF